MSEKQPAVVDVLQDLDYEQKCTSAVVRFIRVLSFRVLFGRPKKCQSAAAYLAKCTTCFRDSLMCQEHRGAVLAEPEVMCAYCEVEGAPEDVFLFIPIGDAA